MDLYSFDDDYVRRLQEGDPVTEEHFYRYFQGLLPKKLRGRGMKSAQDIEDVIQETYMRVLVKVRSEDGIRDGRKFGAFVNQVCNNVHSEWLRGIFRVERLDEDHEEIDPNPEPLQGIVEEETKRNVRRILRELPRRDADILSALFLEELDKDEICRRFDVNRTYLRVLLHRALEKFRAEYRRRLPHVPPRRPPEGGAPAPRSPKKPKPDMPPNETDPGKPSLKS